DGDPMAIDAHIEHVAPRPQGKQGAAWAREEYEFLIHAAREDLLTAKEVAESLGRSPGAVTTRIRKLLPSNLKRNGDWWNTLCDVLDEYPNYPWEDALGEAGEKLLTYAELAAKQGSPTQVAAVSSGKSGLAVQTLSRGEAHLPSRAHSGDAGLDLRYCGSTPLSLTPDSQVLVPTGIAVSIPRGHAGLVCPRSGLSAKHGVTVVNAPGIIDHGYTGEVKVCLTLIGARNPYTIQPGERSAHLVITPLWSPEVVPVEARLYSKRRDDGFGI